MSSEDKPDYKEKIEKLVPDSYSAIIISATDYLPFDASLDSRSFNKEDYRFGFQKQESDNELWNGAVTFKYRVEDPRLGRFFSVDPHYAKYAYNSTYGFAENRLIDCVELKGREAYIVVFPDYQIATPLGNYGGLGHGGSLIIDPSTGDAFYMEYGRYNSSKGNARVIGGSHKVGTVQFGDDSKPTIESLSVHSGAN